MERSRRILPLASALVALLTILAAGPGPGVAAGVRPAAQGIRALVRTGDPAPGGGRLRQLSDPSLNNRGDLAFGALTTNPHASAAVYMLSRGRLVTLASAGQPAPTGGVFRAFSDIILNDRGTVVFLGRTAGGAAPEGLYLARAGKIGTLVAVGQPAPSGGAFTDFANPAINGQDTVAFVGRTAPVLMAGQPAPTGGVFQFFLDGSPALNDRGQVAVVASTTAHATQGIYVVTGGHAVPVVTTDDVAPVGGRFTEFGFVALSAAGTVGFVGRTARSRIREALYTTGRATLVTLARQGEAVTGGGALTTFVNAVMNAQETVVFEPGTPGPVPRALYAATRSGVRVIGRAGEPAPAGGRFTAFSAPALNDRGQLAFVAETDDGRHGIYLVTLR